ncbi:MAG: hypothetical protein M0R02_13385, partial [Bacteroidales bacterium]|nr:hypothetical protein [Bacteroidales bacterium]
MRYVPREEMVSAEGSLRDESLHGEPLHREPLRESTPREDVSPQGMTDGVAAVESVRQALGGAGPVTVGSAPAERRDRGRPRLDLGDPAPATAVATPAGVPATEPAAEPFLCRIGFWQPASRVAVLSAMPPGQRPTPVQITMLTNLLKAIGALGQGLPPVDLIDWPPSSGLGMQGGAGLAAARDYL